MRIPSAFPGVFMRRNCCTRVHFPRAKEKDPRWKEQWHDVARAAHEKAGGCVCECVSVSFLVCICVCMRAPGRVLVSVRVCVRACVRVGVCVDLT